MAKRSHYQSPQKAWNPGTVINVITIISSFIGMGGLTLVGNYYLYGWRLTQNEQNLLKEQETREKNTKEFAGKFDSMNGALGDLKTTSAVQAETLKTISAQLGAYLQSHR